MSVGGSSGMGRAPLRRTGAARGAHAAGGPAALAAPEPLLDAAGIAVQSAERMRLATVPLVLPAAHELPEGVLLAPGGQEATWPVLKVLAASAVAACRQHDWVTASALARGALLHLPSATAAPPSWAAASERDCSPMQAHDACFRIARAPAADGGASFVRGLALALSTFLDEADAPETLAAYADIAQALAHLWAGALGVDARHAAAVMPAALAQQALTGTSDKPAPPRSPIRRWLRGHQVHAGLLQGLIWSVQALPSALVAADDEPLRRALRRITRLQQAAARTLAFAHDGEPGMLARTVVPVRAAAWRHTGGRGLVSADKRRLQALWSTRQSAMKRAEERCPQEFIEMLKARHQHELSAQRHQGDPAG